METPAYKAKLHPQNYLPANGKKQLIIAGVVTEVCVAFPALSAIEEGFDVFVVTDASGTFNEITRHSAWDRMSKESTGGWEGQRTEYRGT